MTAVSTADGIKYGFKLMGYQLLVTIVGGGIAFAGFIFTTAFGAAAVDSGSAEGGIIALLIGGVLLLVGAAVWLAGMAGTTYKVVADAVEAGNESASIGSARATPTGTPQRATGPEARTGRSGGQSSAPSSRSGSTSGTSKSRSGGTQSSSASTSGGRSSTSSSSSTSGSSVETSRRDSSGSRSGKRGSSDRGGSSKRGSSDRSGSSKRGSSDRGGSSSSDSSRSDSRSRRGDE